jgi:hypothetical protein
MTTKAEIIMSAIGGLRCETWLSGFGSAEPFCLFSARPITLIRECGDTVAFAVLVIALGIVELFVSGI